MTQGTLVLLRHGQTEDNLHHIDTGHNDIALTALGEKQASAAGPLIRDIPFGKVYSSPLSRAFNTATLALKAAGQAIPVEKRQEIIEIDDGILTGRSMADDPIVIEYFQQATYDLTPSGGESEKQLVARVRKFFDEEILPRLNRGENILVAAHTGTLRAFDMVMGLYETPEDGHTWKGRRAVPNATPFVYKFTDGVLKQSYAIENPEAPKPKKKPAKTDGQPKP